MRLGVVVGAHGLRGELRVRVDGVDVDGVQQLPTVRLVGEHEEGSDREYEVADARPGRPGECRLALRGIADRDGAEAWRGASVHARRADLPALPPGEFYAFELVGCAVFTRAGAPVGRVREIWETGAADVLVIEDDEGREQLVPAIEPLLARVDRAERRIVVDPPPGLLDGPGSEREPEERERRE